ncbi:hypothetical protein [Nocardioides sp.]|uniref:hypothetical protein n=1 Tax=Nocardioides sp. TaxID=35761 RepID=UPI002736CCEE|nr:hypothetical protein [Nocardioides sp.]MDP3890488.1 hypothetical protein [Nocardioides sp.]
MRLLTSGFPETLAGQFVAISAVIGEVAARHRDAGLDRRGLAFAEAAARYLIHHTQPEGLTFTSATRLHDWFAENVEDLDAADLGATGHVFDRARLMWVAPGGPAAGLLVDRLHHTERSGVIAKDTWVRRKVAEDLDRVHDYLCVASPHTAPERGIHPGVLGVRVLTHLVPNGGLHFTASSAADLPVVGEAHPLGGCAVCVPRTCLPGVTTDLDAGVQPGVDNPSERVEAAPRRTAVGGRR